MFLTFEVPILKMVDSVCGINVDISFNMPGGIASAKIIKQYLTDPYIGSATQSLILILKQLLLQRHLNEVFTGGLGSYALVIMIVAFLSMHPLIQAKQIKPEDNIGILLIEFLELYGKSLNFSVVGVGLELTGGGYFFEKRIEFRKTDFRICVQDPQDKANDVSSGTFASFIIKNELSKAYVRLTSIIGNLYELSDRGKRADTILGSIITVSKDVIAQRESRKDLFASLGDLDKIDLLSMRVQHTVVQPTSSQRKIAEKFVESKKIREVVFVDNSSDDDSDKKSEMENDMDIETAMLNYKLENRDSDASDQKQKIWHDQIDLTLSDGEDSGDMEAYYKFK